MDVFIFAQIFNDPSESLISYQNHSDRLTNIVDGKIGVNNIYNRPPAPKPNCHMHKHDQSPKFDFPYIGQIKVTQ